jgi:glycosyltransferase involved in cell wall biosynthesis
MSSPISTLSGYGARARDFAKSLIKVKGDEWDIKFMSQRWGNTPFGALDENDPEEADIKSRILPPGPLTKQPDIWIQHSVSNEFQPIGKVNIGISALVETTILPGEMIEGLNRMTFNIVSTEFVKQVALTTTMENRDTRVKTVVNKPIEVLFEGVNTNIFKRIENSTFNLSDIKEEFCYLTVAHWLSGDQGEDRKQLTTLIKSFLEAFKNKKNRPALILKTSLAGFSITEKEMIMDKLDAIRKQVDGDLPKIYLLYGSLTNEELNELYNHPKVKAFALVGNEGFGRPYLEFSAASSKPIIASYFSGHIDFLHEDYNIFVPGKVAQVHPSAANQFLLKEASWFKADPVATSKALEEVYTNYNKYTDKGKRQGHRSRTEFSLDKMTEQLAVILDKNVPKLSRPVALTLPKLSTSATNDINFLEENK